MKLCYPKARTVKNKGPYIFLCGAGNAVKIPLGGKPVEVEDDVGHAILSKDGDVIVDYDRYQSAQAAVGKKPAPVGQKKGSGGAKPTGKGKPAYANKDTLTLD